VIRFLLALAWLLLAGGLDGCAHVASAGALWTEPFPRVEVPDLPTPEGAPVVVVVGQPSPLTGFAMPADIALYYSDAAEQRDGLALAPVQNHRPIVSHIFQFVISHGVAGEHPRDSYIARVDRATTEHPLGGHVFAHSSPSSLSRPISTTLTWLDPRSIAGVRTFAAETPMKTSAPAMAFLTSAA